MIAKTCLSLYYIYLYLFTRVETSMFLVGSFLIFDKKLIRSGVGRWGRGGGGMG